MGYLLCGDIPLWLSNAAVCGRLFVSAWDSEACHLSQVARTRFSEAGVSVADILSLCYFFERLWLQPLLATAWQKRIAAETKNSFESLLAGQNSIQQQLGWLDRNSMPTHTK